MATASSRPDASWALLVVPPLLLALMAGGLAFKAGFVGGAPDGLLSGAPQTIVVEPRTFSYRAPGEYTRDGYAVDGPMLTVSVTRPLTIMKYQVSKGDYARCVADGACAAPEPEFPMSGQDEVPVTGVNFDDARAYAAWLSRQTGEVWTVPTDEQLAFAAACGHWLHLGREAEGDRARLAVAAHTLDVQLRRPHAVPTLTEDAAQLALAGHRGLRLRARRHDAGLRAGLEAERARDAQRAGRVELVVGGLVERVAGLVDEPQPHEARVVARRLASAREPGTPGERVA